MQDTPRPPIGRGGTEMSAGDLGEAVEAARLRGAGEDEMLTLERREAAEIDCARSEWAIDES